MAHLKTNFDLSQEQLNSWIYCNKILSIHSGGEEYGLGDTVPLGGNAIRLLPSAMTDILVAQHAENVPRKLSFTLRDALCDYFLANSKFYKEENQDPMQEAISRVVALAGAALRKKTQKGSLATYGPNRPKKQEYYAFRRAVCPQANKKIALTVKACSSNQRLRGYIDHGSNFFRQHQWGSSADIGRYPY